MRLKIITEALIERNNKIVKDYEGFKSLIQIGRANDLHPSTVREILIKALGIKKYNRIREERIKLTAKKYTKRYLELRKSLKHYDKS